MRKGYFGRYGGFFVPEILVKVLQELEESYFTLREDEEFLSRRRELLSNYVGRPTPLYPAEGLSEEVGGAFIHLKREDLAHTGSHKINNALGQALLAKWMGKDRVIAETGAGQHGVATATACALLGLDCEVYMGEVDAERQKLNRYRMELLGAEVRVVKNGTRTLKDAINEALRDFATNSDSTHYLIGSVVGPHPYPTMVRDFQSVIGEEVRRQIQKAIGGMPDSLIACVGGGSNALGLFHPFIDEQVEMHGVEAGGKGIDSGKHSASIVGGSEGVLHGAKSYILQDMDGQIMGAHSIAAGLDYPGVGPEHASLNDSRRVQYHAVEDQQAVAAFHLLSETEGIPPALESAHAIAFAVEHAKRLPPEKHIVVNLSGRGDKDVEQIAEREGAL